MSWFHRSPGTNWCQGVPSNKHLLSTYQVLNGESLQDCQDYPLNLQSMLWWNKEDRRQEQQLWEGGCWVLSGKGWIWISHPGGSVQQAPENKDLAPRERIQIGICTVSRKNPIVEIQMGACGYLTFKSLHTFTQVIHGICIYVAYLVFTKFLDIGNDGALLWMLCAGHLSVLSDILMFQRLYWCHKSGMAGF